MADFAGKRAAAVAGQFYPRHRQELESELNRCLGPRPARTVPAAASVRALIVPHAGYQFSGPTAGRGYAALQDTEAVERVVVLAPTHRVPFRGVSVGDYAAYSTPLGDIQVDAAACRDLTAASPLVSNRRDAHVTEHALEVQLPFLQTVLHGFSLVPVVCGDLDQVDMEALAAVLVPRFWRADTLWIVSTDFTHFGRAFGYVPFRREVPERLRELDTGAVERILEQDVGGFLDYVGSTGATICGRVPIGLLLAVLQASGRRWQTSLLHYTTSGEITGDYEHTVSYAALAVATPAATADAADPGSGGAALALSDADKTQLLQLARTGIAAALAGRDPEPPSASLLSPSLQAERACFVTLYCDGDLRGCIGALEASEPLFLNVLRNARSAAFSDSRFLPLTTAEFARTTIDVSVLTPLRPIAQVTEFQVGRHGIVMEKGRRRAVFLPQVAPEQGWDRDTTLDFLARKAGLDAGAWRRGAHFRVFEAVVFGEMEFGPGPGP